VAYLVKTVFTEQDKRDLMRISLELLEIRKLVDQLAETMVNLSDKELLKAFNASQNDIKEKQIDRYTETLEKQIDIAEKEFQPI
jgi:glutathionyl-hydroquinone reductase